MENKLSELSFDEFKDLVSFLKEIGKEKINRQVYGANELNEFVSSNIGRFFPEMSAMQTIKMNSLIYSLDEEEFNFFKEENPSLYIDCTGKGKPKEKNYWEITLESLKQLYDFSVDSPAPVAKQTINALTLNCLRDKRYYGYIASRKMFLQKFQNINPEIFIALENFYKEFLGAQETSILLGQFTGYCLSEKMKSKFEVFVDHFIRRSECLLMEQTSLGSVTNEENVKFLKNIRELIKQYFIKS